MEVKARNLQICILLISITTVFGFYLIADYYMNPNTSDAFGGSCDEVVEDASLYINSHINPLKWFNYGGDKDCVMTLDAGSMGGALFKIDWMYFDLENSAGCTKDYLKIYDSDIAGMAPGTLLGTFCGSTTPTVRFGTQRYLTLEFHADSSGSGDGFRFRGTRTEPSPCQDDEFHCTTEDVCIDERLKCDGTRHCNDDLDESDCSFFEELIGSIIALGMGGMVGVGIAFIGGCVGIWTLVCVFTVCKKCCGFCCTTCCCFWPCCKGRTCGKSKVDPDSDPEYGLELPEKKPANDNDIEIQGDDEDGDFFDDDDGKPNQLTVAPHGSSKDLMSQNDPKHTKMTGVGQQNNGFDDDVDF
ncbi:low-density lipoprotein receptor-related protein 12-like isoform X1 [Mytilus edulis]